MNQYKLSSKISSTPISPDEVAHALLGIQQKYGRLNPRDVYREARSKNHPLHNCFTWDKDKAAEKCWTEEARQLIRSVLVAVELEGRTVYTREFINLMRDADQNLTHNPFNANANEGTYDKVADVFADPKLREYAIARAMRELESFERKYASFSEFTEVFSAIAKAKKSIKKNPAIAN